MTTDTDAVAAEISSRWPRRRSPKFYCVIAVLVAGMATWIVLSLVDRRYGPIEPGFFAAPYSRANAGFTKTGTEYIKGRPGSEVSRYYGLENHGSHDVVVTSVDPIAPAVRVQWSDYVVRPGGDETGERRPWRDFPATIPAHGTIRVLVTIRKPRQCDLGERYQATVNVHWNSLLGGNTTTVTLEFSENAS